LIRNDPWLKPYRDVITSRAAKARAREIQVLAGCRSLRQYATGHLYYGLHREADRWVLREWAPNARALYLIGEFSSWKDEDRFAFGRQKNGNWILELPLDILRHGNLYKLHIHWEGGAGERIPAWATRVVQDPDTLIFSAQVWDPPVPYQWKNPGFTLKKKPPLIYEAHIGMATEEYRVGTYDEFRRSLLPRMIAAGYDTLQLMAIQEHPYYGSFGYHVSSFFAASSRFGTPEDLKALIDEAHQAGIAVIMDLVHSHAVKNEVEGLGGYDGTPYQFFHEGKRREHVAWDSLCFDYGKNEVVHFLLSNCAYWLGEYRFDGFRFDGITSMLYFDHGLERKFTNYGMYFDGNQDEDALAYLTLANKLIHQLRPDAITIAEDMSGMPGLALPIRKGGYGFDYRLAMGTPDYWIRIIKEVPDEHWNISEIFYELTNRRANEQTIGYAESHDQALVGDQTIIFRLMGKEMYDCMGKQCRNLGIDRGMALHKMIRLITIASAGSGYLNFMGNEFGHPEWIDFPREGNNWSYHYARRQWSLADDRNLRYHFLADFDRGMIALIKRENCFRRFFPVRAHAHEPDQVLAFERSGLFFVFNFHPSRSYTEYGIPAAPGQYRIVLTSDDLRYGGFGRIDQSLTYDTYRCSKPPSVGKHCLRLYLPSRMAIVLKKMPAPSRR
jgi:1,4-alpha-glucan branching enzyme